MEKKSNLSLDILLNIARQFGKSKEGTYNEADPTHYERVYLWGLIDRPVFDDGKDEEGNQVQNEGYYMETKLWFVDLNDVTWGINVEVHEYQLNDWNAKVIDMGNNYWDNGWQRSNGIHMDWVIETFLKEAKFISNKKAEEYRRNGLPEEAPDPFFSCFYYFSWPFDLVI